MARPNYHLFENNCQNFSKFLIEAITPGSVTPETIQNVLERWQTLLPPAKNLFPGTYPLSDKSTSTNSSGSYVTALGTISLSGSLVSNTGTISNTDVVISHRGLEVKPNIDFNKFPEVHSDSHNAVRLLLLSGFPVALH